MIVIMVMIQVFYCTKTRDNTNIRLVGGGGGLVFDSSRLQERIFVQNFDINFSQSLFKNS